MSARGASLHTTTPVDADHRPMSMLHACASLLERCWCCCCFRSPGVVRCPPRAGPSVYDVPHGAEVGVAWLAEKRTDTLVVVEQERILPGRCHLTHEIRCGGNCRNEKRKHRASLALCSYGLRTCQCAALGHCQKLTENHAAKPPTPTVKGRSTTPTVLGGFALSRTGTDASGYRFSHRDTGETTIILLCT